MKIIGAGLGRTGTSSLKVALERLGFGPCYHMQEINKHPEHIPTWFNAMKGHDVDWQTFLQSYQATLDWPACDHYAVLMDVYPEAKVILSVRDPKRWYDSVDETIYTFNKTFPNWAKSVAPKLAAQVDMTKQQVWQRKFYNRFEDRAYAIDIFQQHNETVQQVVPTERLLVYEVSQGWTPLCNFLDVPIPTDTPFPHVNDKAQFQKLIAWLHSASKKKAQQKSAKQATAGKG
ncbi:MAG: sulfotransferase family protein [Chloroflexota bacterium]